VGALAAVLWWRVGGLLTGLFAAMNLAAAFGSLSPLPSVDGEVILRELARLRRGRDSA
jgi:Zn-dependent protease